MAPTSVTVGVTLAVISAFCVFFYVFGIPGFTRFNLPRNETITSTSMRELLSVSIVLAERGGKRVKEVADAQSLNFEVKGKTKEGAAEMLTQGDLESYRAIVNGFLKEYPGMTVISEEHENKVVDFNQIPDVDKQLFEVISSVPSDQQIPIDNIAVWVDPLDATQEYIEGLYQYVTTMVCVTVNGEPTIGVIHKPFTGETVWAWADYGHSPNVKEASGRTRNENYRLIITSRSYGSLVEKVAKESFGDNVDVIPVGGVGYKIVEVIQGEMDAYVQIPMLKKWDICAGNAILKALNGKMTTLEGNYITYYPIDSPKNQDGVLATMYNHHDYLKKLTPELEALWTKRQG